MTGVSIFILIGLGFCGKWGSALFLNNRPFPTYSLEDMPDTDFSCRDKILGGYYADSQTQCQMFHVCVKVAGVGVQDFRFLCPNSTAFDQEHQICADWEDVGCDASTLYYSSDNFDLYRIGSGFETKAVKYGEEEEPFALQRAETGDIRLNREHQTQRVNQHQETLRNKGNTAQRQQSNQRSNNNYNNEAEKDIFKVSSSSNFFNNRNSGKETDEDDDDTSNINANQNDDRFQKRKLIQKTQNKQRFEEPQTQKPSQPTGFINNYAGSSYTTTSRSVQTTIRNEPQPNDGGRQRQRQRGNYNYNENNSRPNTGRYQEDNGQYRNDNSGQYNHNSKPQYTVSTPAPFRRSQQNTQYTANNEQPKPAQSTENPPNNYYSQYNTQSRNNQNYQSQTAETQSPSRQTQNYPSTPFTRISKETENYPSNNFQKVNNFPSTPVGIQGSEKQNYSPTPFKEPSKPFEKATKETENYPSTPFKQQPAQTYTSTPFKDTQTYTPTVFQKSVKESDAATFKTAPQETIPPFYNKDTTSFSQPPNKPAANFDNFPTPSPSNGNTQQYQSNYEITKNKQSEYSTQNFKKPTVYTKPGEIAPTTFAPKRNSFKTPTFSESYSSTVDYKNAPQQQNGYNSNYNQQAQVNRQTTKHVEYKQTTQYTHYTPTVPRITTPYYSSTTPEPKRSSRFDETQYDDGSYNPKYDKEDGEDEVLKTAHSINFASSRNEYFQNAKNNQPSLTEKPRPFSVTPNPPKPTTFIKPSSDSKIVTKKSKDYDYAYYDTNNHERDYDAGIDIAKSPKSNPDKNNKNA